LRASLGDSWIRPTDGMVMVYVPGGRFNMGSDQTHPDTEDDEVPRHLVALSSFWIDQTEVTNAQFARCVAAGACTPPHSPALAIHEGYYQDPEYARYPVINVDWQQGQSYCDWAGGQLPTEAQWEYAARGPDERLYPWGDRPPDETLLNYAGIVNNTTPVGSYAAGASWVGALDMAGNVWEWTADWYRLYDPDPQVNPRGPDQGIGHVLRGGSWSDGAPFARSANRYVVREAYAEYGKPRSYGFGVGFRCVVWTSELPPHP
jgi:formylglycine-generating enzyme required for sulfatase activity